MNTAVEERPARKLELVGLREIATMLRVQPRTPTMWRNRSIKGELDPPMPEPDGFISGTIPVWEKRRIIAWAKKTGRWPTESTRAA